MEQTTSVNIILNCQFKTCNGWVARVKFLCKTKTKKAHVAKSLAQQQKEDINILHAELGHPLRVITLAIGPTIRFHVAVTRKTCEDYALGKAVRGAGRKAVV